jgi:23S rRNA (guanosine2251-2'-O)-methyltransferase
MRGPVRRFPPDGDRAERADRPPYRGGPPAGRPAWRPPDRGGPPPGARPWPRPRFEPAPWSRPEAALPAPDLLGPDEELVAGRRPVEEVFAAGRLAHRLLVVPQRRSALEQLVLHATRLRIPIVEVEGGSLTALAGFDGHQGVALVVEPRRFATLDDILDRAAERDEPPFVLVLDSLEDPQNVGTLLRSAEAAGAHGIVFPTRRQAPLSPAAVKASAGAVEHLLLAPVDDLAGALADLHAHGLRIAGSEADAPLTARQTDLRGPLAIVVGSEGQGLGPAVRRRCDLFMRIPMRGAIGSLNAAVAGSVLLFEAVAQRDPDDRRPVPTAPAEAAQRPRASNRSGAASPIRAHEPDAVAPEPAVEAPEPDPDPAVSEARAGDDMDLLPGGPPTEAPPAPMADPPAATAPKPRKPRAPRTPHA